MRIAFIVKGTIKKKRKFYDELAWLENQNTFEEVTCFETEYAKHAITLAEEATKKQFNVLVAVGGDGTLNEVLNGMMNGKVSEQQITLGYLSYGTANDFGKTVQLDGSMKQLHDLCEKEQITNVDIGNVTFTTEEAEEASRYFINIADVGLGGYVVEKVNKSKKRLGPNLTFMKAITESFLTYEQTPVRCKADSFEWEGKILSLVIANGQYFGSGLCIAPHAKIDDGKFAITILADISMKDYLLNLNKIKKGKKVKHEKAFYFEAKEIEVTPIDFSCAIDLDGEFPGYAPIKVKMIPGAVRLLMPKLPFADPSLAYSEQAEKRNDRIDP